MVTEIDRGQEELHDAALDVGCPECGAQCHYAMDESGVVCCSLCFWDSKSAREGAEPTTAAPGME